MNGAPGQRLDLEGRVMSALHVRDASRALGSCCAADFSPSRVSSSWTSDAPNTVKRLKGTAVRAICPAPVSVTSKPFACRQAWWILHTQSNEDSVILDAIALCGIGVSPMSGASKAPARLFSKRHHEPACMRFHKQLIHAPVRHA